MIGSLELLGLSSCGGRGRRQADLIAPWSPLSDRDFIMDWFVFLLREGEEVDTGQS
jgi:hypothetical protein